MLAARAGGDARTALSALELACETAMDSVTVEHAEDALQRRIVHYDKAADSHYDTISAWIKATRGSDPDASLYYLAVMLEGGEDPRFIARRMVILASEDIGNADPNALTVATGAAAAVEHAGLPECQFALAQAAIYLSLAPKSDAAKRAIGAARDFVREHGAAPPPVQLRSGGRGQGYDYPHSHPGHFSDQELAPERGSRRALLQARRRRGRARGATGQDSPRARSRRLSGRGWTPSTSPMGPQRRTGPGPTAQISSRRPPHSPAARRARSGAPARRQARTRGVPRHACPRRSAA